VRLQRLRRGLKPVADYLLTRENRVRYVRA
jgi:hypothetical protein